MIECFHLPRPSAPGTPPAGTVLTPADFTYQGFAKLPLDIDGVTRYGFSTGAMTGHVVSGTPHIYITGANWDTGWNDPVYELTYNGVGNRMTFVQNWGDLTKGSRPTLNMGTGRNLRSLLWDESTGQITCTYMDGYANSWDPSFYTSTLDSPGATTRYGPWTPGTKSQYCAGYTFTLPARAQAALGGKKFASGAPYSSIDSGSTFGTFFTAWSLPANGTAPDTPGSGHTTLVTTDLIVSNLANPQSRIDDVDYCGWTHYGESDAFGDQPQLNSTQNGTGCTPHGLLCGAPFGYPTFGHANVWLPGDQVGSAVWIEGATKQGVVYFGQIARTMAANASEYGTYGKCHVWYGPGQEPVHGYHLCSHGQTDLRYGVGTGNSMTTAMSTLWIYDPAVLLAIAGGSGSNIGVAAATDCYDMSLLPNSGTPFQQLATSWSYPWGSQFAAAWFEPTSKTLFLSDMHGEFVGVEWRPIVHVFSVNC